MMNNNLFALYQQIRSNPAQVLAQRGIQVPNGVNVNDPNAIMQYMLNSGAVSQDFFNKTVAGARNNPIAQMLLSRR